MDTPYISFVLATRNDNHGGDLLKRLERFIHFFDISFNDTPSNFYELVVVDWNPPGRSKRISEAIDWDKIRSARHIVIDSNEHKRIEESAKLKRPMYDYIARNVGINAAQGRFICILNQDIILSSQLSEFVKNKKLKNNFFYRADRIDINIPVHFDKLNENFMLSNATAIHRRHRINSNISLNSDLDLSKIPLECSIRRKRSLESIIELGKGKNSILSKYYLSKHKSSSLEILLAKLGLHTNASGDFIIASRKAWQRIGGFENTTDFYMHIDSYCVCKFWASGLRQALFKYPAYIFHCNHELSDHESKELISYSHHRQILKEILSGYST
jgi:GT2 family glycosyltransferase